MLHTFARQQDASLPSASLGGTVLLIRVCRVQQPCCNLQIVQGGHGTPCAWERRFEAKPCMQHASARKRADALFITEHPMRYTRRCGSTGSPRMLLRQLILSCYQVSPYVALLNVDKPQAAQGRGPAPRVCQTLCCGSLVVTANSTAKLMVGDVVMHFGMRGTSPVVLAHSTLRAAAAVQHS